MLAPPSVRQREHEAHIVFEPLPPGTPLPDLIASNGPLRALASVGGVGGVGGLGGVPEPSSPLSSAALRHVIALWGRQLLLALQCAHRCGILLRSLRLSHIFVS